VDVARQFLTLAGLYFKRLFHHPCDVKITRTCTILSYYNANLVTLHCVSSTQPFLDFFGEVMTGVRPKSDFLQPLLLLEIGLELVNQFVVQYVFRRAPLMIDNIGVDMVAKQAASKAKAGNASVVE